MMQERYYIQASAQTATRQPDTNAGAELESPADIEPVKGVFPRSHSLHREADRLPLPRTQSFKLYDRERRTELGGDVCVLGPTTYQDCLDERQRLEAVARKESPNAIAFEWALVRRFAKGHSYWRDISQTNPCIAICDSSGEYPHLADDGVLWVDGTRSLTIGEDTALIPLVTPAGEPTCSPITLEELLWVAAVLEMKIEAFHTPYVVRFERERELG